MYTKNDDDDDDNDNDNNNTIWDRPNVGVLRMIKNIIMIIKIL